MVLRFVRVLKAHVENGRVLLDEPIADGTEVRVVVDAAAAPTFDADLADVAARVVLRAEVPELREGSVEVVALARRAGQRTKIAVRSCSEDVDPVGAVLGEDGGRIMRVVKRLGDAEIDIVPWSDEPARFVCDALAPLVIERLVIDEDNHRMELFVPDEHVDSAPGEDGLRLQLAAELTGWKIDVYRLSRYRLRQ